MTSETFPSQPAPPIAPQPQSELVRTYRWSPTQLVVLALGILWTAIAGIALARAGAIGITGVLTPEVTVGAWMRTPILAGLEIALGLMLLIAGSQRLIPKVAYRFIGGIGMAFGIVLIGAPELFEDSLGAGRSTGLLYVVFGIIMLVVGFMAPIVFEREQIVDGVETTTR